MDSIDSKVIFDKIIKGLDELSRRASLKKKEIEKLRSTMASTKIKIVEKKEEKKEEEISYTEIVDTGEDFESEVEYYLSELLKTTDEELIDVLPTKNNYHYESIMLRLMAEITKDIKDIKEIIITESMDKSELQEYKDEVLSLGNRRNIIKKCLLEEEKSETTKKENKLIFMPIKGSNKIRVFDEIKDIPSEDYDGFLELLESIKDGTFKNIKRFVNNDMLKGALEVKGYQRRIVFQRLSKDCYAVITMFTKKTQNDRGYQQQLKYKYGEYKDLEKELKEKINDPIFLEENKKLEEELFKMLGKDKGVSK